MNKLPDHILDIIYDYVSDDSVYWRTEFNKVIQYLNEYSDVVVSDMDRINMYRDEDYIDIFVFNILEYQL